MDIPPKTGYYLKNSTCIMYVFSIPACRHARTHWLGLGLMAMEAFCATGDKVETQKKPGCRYQLSFPNLIFKVSVGVGSRRSPSKNGRNTRPTPPARTLLLGKHQHQRQVSSMQKRSFYLFFRFLTTEYENELVLETLGIGRRYCARKINAFANEIKETRPRKQQRCAGTA